MGHKVVEELVYAQHNVAFFDMVPPPESVASKVQHIMGDRDSLAFYKDEFVDFEPDVVVHLSANSTEDAVACVETFQDMVSHLIVTSNANVYLAHARMKMTEPGPSLAVPIDEKSPLREKPLHEETQGDNKEVEVVVKTARLPTTILRMAPLYGPYDYHRRFFPIIVRMIDERPHILLGSEQASWKWTHCYVNDAAHAISLTVKHPGDRLRIFNVGELKTPNMRERIEHIGAVFGWEGRVGVVPETELPEYMRTPGDFAQDMELDTKLIRKEIGYKEPSDYYDGLADSVEWYRDNPPKSFKGQRFDYSAEDAVSPKVFE